MPVDVDRLREMVQFLPPKGGEYRVHSAESFASPGPSLTDQEIEEMGAAIDEAWGRWQAESAQELEQADQLARELSQVIAQTTPEDRSALRDYITKRLSRLEAAMPNKPGSQHCVVPSQDGGWHVKRDGADRSSGHFDKKQDAVDAGRKISQNQGTEFVMHNKDGKIAGKDSHGNDPFPPKG